MKVECYSPNCSSDFDQICCDPKQNILVSSITDSEVIVTKSWRCKKKKGQFLKISTTEFYKILIKYENVLTQITVLE